MGLEALRRGAEEKAAEGNHIITWSDPFHGVSKSVQSGICKRCWLDIHINTRPAYREESIAGKVLTEPCVPQGDTSIKVSEFEPTPLVDAYHMAGELLKKWHRVFLGNHHAPLVRETEKFLKDHGFIR